MNVLVLGLYAEGSTDYEFLPSVIQRTADQILFHHKRSEIEASVLIIKLTTAQKKDRAESILQAAREACGYDVLIVHSDADHPKPDKARIDRIEPGFQRVLATTKEEMCRNLVPIVPVQAIEAWMLADYKALLTEIGTDLNLNELGIPESANQVESISKPKRRLQEVVQKARANRPKRQRNTSIDFLYQPLGEQVRLERLNEVESYRKFKEDLTTTLVSLNKIPVIHEL